MKKNLSTIILLLALVAGLSLLLYPTFSNYWNSKTQSRAIYDYEASLKQMTREDYSELFQEAYEYNAKLFALNNPLVECERLEGYDQILSIGGKKIIGYITIDKIHVELPIYHGTSNAVLNTGVGHLEGSSFPTGEMNTHAVLSAHRGLPSAKLFTNLDQLKEGDRFLITVLDKLYTYEVDQIRIVLPNELEELKIVEDQTYCTLLTCTPYGVNTHRLLVRGRLVENEKPALYIPAEAFEVDSLLIAPLIAIPILLVLLVILLLKPAKKKPMKGGSKDSE